MYHLTRQLCISQEALVRPTWRLYKLSKREPGSLRHPDYERVHEGSHSIHVACAVMYVYVLRGYAQTFMDCITVYTRQAQRQIETQKLRSMHKCAIPATAEIMSTDLRERGWYRMKFCSAMLWPSQSKCRKLITRSTLDPPRPVDRYSCMYMRMFYVCMHVHAKSFIRHGKCRKLTTVPQVPLSTLLRICVYTSHNPHNTRLSWPTFRGHDHVYTQKCRRAVLCVCADTHTHTYIYMHAEAQDGYRPHYRASSCVNCCNTNQQKRARTHTHMNIIIHRCARARWGHTSMPSISVCKLRSFIKESASLATLGDGDSSSRVTPNIRAASRSPRESRDRSCHGVFMYLCGACS